MMHTRSDRPTALSLLWLASVALSACSSGSGQVPSASFQITPTGSDVSPGGTVKFQAMKEGTSGVPVAWKVQEPNGGSIDASGKYTAPDAEGTYHVLATSQAASPSSPAEVRVRKRGIQPVTVSPHAAELSVGGSLTLTVELNGAAEAGTWSVEEGAAGGSVNASGLYVAPQTPGTYHVIVASVADPAQSDRATITVAPAQPPPVPPTPATQVVVAVSPAAAVVQAGQAVQLSAGVSGSSDMAVSWSVAEGSSGGAVNASGLYTAPFAGGTFHVVATSHADPARSFVASVTVTPAFYVSPSGNDGNPGTLSQPWRTIQKSMNSATPGSTVLIRGGTYNERLVLNVSGLPGAFVTFQPYGWSGSGTGEQVVLDYGYLGTVTDQVPFLKITGRGYVRIQGLTFQNFTCYGLMQQGVRIDGASSQIEFKQDRFLGNKNSYPAFDGSAALLHFRIWGPAHDVLVEGCEFGNINTVQSEVLTADGGATNVTIRGNYLHDTDGIAIDVHGGANNVSISQNTLEFIGRRRDGSIWYNNPANVLYVDGGHHVTIERNLVRDSEYAIAALAEPGQPVAHDVVIRDNVLIRCFTGTEVGTWYSNTDGSSVYGISVLNNTYYQCTRGAVIRPYQSGTVAWKNNIFAGCANPVVNDLGWAAGSFDYNLYSGGASGPDVHKVTADPQFGNPGAGDFSIGSASPAAGAGDASVAATLLGASDFSGGARVVGGRVDLGAYEAP